MLVTLKHKLLVYWRIHHSVSEDGAEKFASLLDFGEELAHAGLPLGTGAQLGDVAAGDIE